MTGRTTFGDLAETAIRHLLAPAQHLPVTGPISPGQVAAQADEFLAVLPRLLKTVSRYAADIAAETRLATRTRQEQASPWARAAADAHHAAQNAYRALLSERPASSARPHPQMTSSLTRDLDAAATAITAARDLLHTHFQTSADGARRDRSEWASIVASAPVRRALLAELAEWSRHIVSHGTLITSAPPRNGSGPATGQRKVIAICRPLTALITAVETAQRREPATGDDIGQLYNIPASMLHPRSIPGRAETIVQLQHGIIECAERVRSAAATAVTDAAWSPAISPESFIQTAMCAAVISHHCEILQQSLAARAAQLGATRLRSDLVASAAAAARARRAWLAAARAWYYIKTDALGELSPAAGEAADLAQWTGRLTYADPGWSLTSQPAGHCRPPQQLAPDPDTFTCALTAVHQAASTLTILAAADYGQIRAAARNGRLFVPAIQVRGSAGSVSAYTRTPGSSSNTLLAAYRNAGTASVKAADKILRIAAQHKATDGQTTRWSAAPRSDRPIRGRVASAIFINLTEPDPPPGPIERIMADLGVTEPDLLNKGKALDESVIQLIADAADRTAPQRWHTAATRPGAVTNSSAVTRHVLAADDPTPTAKLHSSLRALAAGGQQTRPELGSPRRRYTAPSPPPAQNEWPRAS